MLNRLVCAPPDGLPALPDEGEAGKAELPPIPPLAVAAEDVPPTWDVHADAPPAVISAPLSTLRAVMMPENGAVTR